MRGNNYLVSVIIPAKNRVDLLCKAIDSVYNQKVSVEVIVVDDKSDQPIKQKLQKYSNIVILRNSQVKGPGASRNIGLNKATGKYIAFLDSDDYWENGFLKACISKLEAQTNLTSCMTLTHKLYSKEFPTFSYLKLLFLNLIKDKIILISYIINSGNLINSYVYLGQISQIVFRHNKINNLSFETSYKYCEDWKFILDSSHKGNIGIVPKVLSNFRYSMNSNTFTQDFEKRKYYKYFLNNLGKNYKKSFGYNLFKFYLQYFLV